MMLCHRCLRLRYETEKRIPQRTAITVVQGEAMCRPHYEDALGLKGE